MNAFIFECNENTYLECIQKNLFGSNVPWPLQVKQGDLCLLYHLNLGTLFGIWEASSDGARAIVPRAWGGRFPFQARVKLVSPEILEIPKASVADLITNPATGRHENVIGLDKSEPLIQVLKYLHI